MRVVYGIIDPKTGDTPVIDEPGKFPLVLTAVTLVVPERNNPHDPYQEPYVVMIMELADESNMPKDEDKQEGNSNGNTPH
jgi:hypothetical protein